MGTQALPEAAKGQSIGAGRVGKRLAGYRLLSTQPMLESISHREYLLTYAYSMLSA